jgi:excisionase family DNA binding protein
MNGNDLFGNRSTKENEMSANGRSVLGEVSRAQALRDVAWVAEFLGVSKSWVYQAVAAGRLPCVRIGAAVRFDPNVIRAWVRGEGSGAVVKLPSCR